MKIIIGSLLFTFLVFLNSVELSSQSSTSGSGNNGPPRDPRAIRVIVLPNLAENVGFVLPNGNFYVSRGTGQITVMYNPVTRIATVSQRGGHTEFLGPGSFPETPYLHFPTMQEHLARQRQQRPPPNDK